MRIILIMQLGVDLLPGDDVFLTNRINKIPDFIFFKVVKN